MGPGDSRKVKAPTSIVVVHGVGDHKEDETARVFARALAQARSPETGWSLPSLVARVGDVQCETGPPPGAAGGPLPGAFTFSAYEIGVPWPARKWGVPLYEFFWSDLSRKGLGLLGEVAKIWRFLVGTPRIGYQALTCRAVGGPGDLLLTVARATYCLSWLLIIARMIAALAILLMLGAFKVTWLRYYDIVLGFDLATCLSLLAFTAARWLLAIADRAASRVTSTASLALAVTILFTQGLPLTILEVTGLDRRAAGMEPWYHLGAAYEGWPGVRPSHFYSINSLPFLAVYLMYGLIALWALLVMAIQYGLSTLLVRYPAARSVASAAQPNPKRDRVVARMKRVVAETRAFWGFVSWLAVTLIPLLFWVDFLTLVLTGEAFYTYDPKSLTAANTFVRTLSFSWVYFLVYLFVFLVWGLLTWPTLRRVMAPALELSFDVGAYFPPVLRSLTPEGVLDVLRGREMLEAPDLLVRQLADRLRAIIAYADSQKPGPVAVIGHSLGSVIAMSALKQGPVTRDGREVEVVLVTMGSPLKMLIDRFPHLYGPDRWSRYHLGGVRRWLNLYRAADPIGRELGIRIGPEGAGPGEADRPSFDEVNLCNGGHSRYFEDPDVATFLVHWLFPSAESSPDGPA